MKFCHILKSLFVAFAVCSSSLSAAPYLVGPGYQSDEDGVAPWSDFVRFAVDDRDRIHVNPTIPLDWDWIAVRDVEFDGERFNFFFWQGIVFSGHSRARQSVWRVSSYPTDLTPYLTCSSFSLAMMREREAVAIVVADKSGPVDFRLDGPVFGEPIELTIEMKEGEARLLRFFLDQPPFRP